MRHSTQWTVGRRPSVGKSDSRRQGRGQGGTHTRFRQAADRRTADNSAFVSYRNWEHDVYLSAISELSGGRLLLSERPGGRTGPAQTGHGLCPLSLADAWLHYK